MHQDVLPSLSPLVWNNAYRPYCGFLYTFRKPGIVKGKHTFIQFLSQFSHIGVKSFKSKERPQPKRVSENVSLLCFKAYLMCRNTHVFIPWFSFHSQRVYHDDPLLTLLFSGGWEDPLLMFRLTFPYCFFEHICTTYTEKFFLISLWTGISKSSI